MSKNNGPNNAYSLQTPEDSVKLYRVWASTYDKDFAEKNDYRSPIEIANYYEKYCEIDDTPILDVGSGTGLVGENLRNKNISNIDGIDISSESNDVARSKNIYSKLIEADLTKSLNIKDSQYGAIVSAGTFTHGHVGANTIDELIRITKPNGLFVISIHSTLYKKAGFDQKLLQKQNKISEPKFHEVRIYGNNKNLDHGNDTVLITVFRKNK